MLPAARVFDLHFCPLFTPAVPPIPHVGGPVLPPGGAPVLIGGMPAARLADMCFCVGPPDVIAAGAATVLVGGLPAARLFDQEIHGGLLLTGSPTVLIGGPTFSLPPNFKIDGPPSFQNKVIRDLYFLSTTPSGAKLIQRLEAAGETVTFVPNPGTNGFCSPTDWDDARSGTPTGSVIQYNPDYRSNAYDSSGNLIAQPPQVILAHEMCHALANSEGTHRQGTDPSPPASEPNIEEEEAQAIGTGSHTGRTPSENSVRSDLGLPARDNHFGTGGPAPGEPAPLNLRPGGP
jgi:uncharacterized Zn-binding protein involved in type VI secretion